MPNSTLGMATKAAKDHSQAARRVVPRTIGKVRTQMMTPRSVRMLVTSITAWALEATPFRKAISGVDGSQKRPHKTFRDHINKPC